MTPLNAQQAMDAYFLEARSKLLDLAAIFDRIDRGTGEMRDPRWEKLRTATELLRTACPDRAVAIQELFSLPYDPDWTRPVPGAGEPSTRP